ncbi:stress-response A/B barrel domain-containing protein UP3 [Momordica charantia]|uniref:Stress-response A/B barrel domain-containing protein UP3 n=1 Tax=Momordica charantia TaxID=3673 RepID=A0A6J1C445_MOMCH|nr:stress-response A/B barrel domain-containing protein UP3 [Momordica charantia]XP_022136510.1 stress-response A/B barrel domain-containing protein UP3 [Momordica charantia]XP_022136511.1 stress-response A/B barrel domain-containing protein UP3 [Momordica charantia]XP_022136512.1 stress-response A/B barrel domain-containing protein UP3 [Momordica charantia]XP_022136513.1 stress-response A/B barrel domain-containing protein UP3 [Momordica charantia]XP_022136514.1 stress-response A/B barrel dom
MLIQAHSPNPHFFFLAPNPSVSRHFSLHVSHLCGLKAPIGRRSARTSKISASGEHSPTNNLGKKRKVFEHISLLKAKENISEKEENDMLDYLYTTQYQMGGIVAVSLGRACDQNNERYTHCVYMRFQRKEDLEKFYVNPFYSRVLKEHVMPYCHGLIHVDYESEVEDDMLPIFRKGEEFNYGVEFVLLIKFLQDSFGEPLEDALNSLERLTIANPSLIVQFTQGFNFNPSCKEFTHGIVIRFRSINAFEIFTGCSDYKEMWRSKFQPIIQKTVSLHFSVDPVGTEIM